MLGRRRRAVAVMGGPPADLTAQLIGAAEVYDTLSAATVNITATMESGATGMVLMYSAYASPTPVNVSSATFDGDAMTVVKTTLLGRNIGAIYIIGAAAKTATVSITMTGATLGDSLGLIKQCFWTASPGAHVDADSTFVSPGTSTSLTLTATGSNQINFDFMVCVTTGVTVTATGTDHSKITEADLSAGNPEFIVMGDQPTASSGDHAISWTMQSSNYVHVAITFP